MSFELNIVDMYSDILNIYGDIGNLKCIKKRCEWRGIKVNQKSYSLNHDMSFDYEDIDLILIGGGSDRTQSIVSNDLLKQRNDLENYVENDGVILTVCGSYQMFGQEYYDVNGDNVSCLEIFDIKTVSQENRLIGNILIENNLGLAPKEVVGFENHGGRTFHNYKTLGKVIAGHGNNDEEGEEGMIYKNFIGTYLHGPFLPKNPHIADYLILNAMKNKYNVDSIEELDDEIEFKAHDVMVNRLK